MEKTDYWKQNKKIPPLEQISNAAFINKHYDK